MNIVKRVGICNISLLFIQIMYTINGNKLPDYQYTPYRRRGVLSYDNIVIIAFKEEYNFYYDNQ